MKEYLNKIEPYLKDIINNFKKSDVWKIQLIKAINFVFSKDIEKERAMHSKSYKIEIMIYDKADQVIQELFESLLSRHYTGLEESMKSSDFIFNCVNLLHNTCHKIHLKRGGSYIYFSDWIKKKKVTINVINYNNKFFQYAATVALNHEEIGKHAQRI